MQYGLLKVAAVTPKIKVADTGYNKTQIISLIERGAQAEAQIMVFPELCITGSTCQDLFFQKSLLDGAKDSLGDIIKATVGIKSLIFVGLPIEYRGKIYNVSAAIYGGRLLALIPKMHIDSSQKRYFAPGKSDAVQIGFMGESIPFGSSIILEDDENNIRTACEMGTDGWSLIPPSTYHAAAGALIIVNPMADAYSVGRNDYRRNVIKNISGKLFCGYISSNAGEGESSQDLVFDGEAVVAENGSLITRSALFTLGITYAEIDTQILYHERCTADGWPGCDDDKYRVIRYGAGLIETLKEFGGIIKGTFDKTPEKKPIIRKYSINPFVPQDASDRERRLEEILNAQALGLKKRMSHIGAATAVIGVSGGLDSTLALIVAAKAFDMLKLPRNGITAVTMPGFGTTDRTHDNACTLAQTLGLSLKEISIANAVRAHFKDIGHDESVHDVTYENAQARERTQILMDLANMTGALMIGTGDLSELALGWATYNGDHMSMYGVNGGIPKTLIRHVVRHYADNCLASSNEDDKLLGKTLYDILDTPISPELLPPKEGEINQKTEDLVGPYELHDFFLYYMLRYGFSPKKIYFIACEAFKGMYEEEIIKKWLRTCIRRFFGQHFKRTCLPDGPKIGSISISPRGGLNMPTDACADLWLKEVDEI